MSAMNGTAVLDVSGPTAHDACLARASLVTATPGSLGNRGWVRHDRPTPDFQHRPRRRLWFERSHAPLDSWTAVTPPAGELVHVERVAPGVELAVTVLKGPHDRQPEPLGGELEDIHP